MRTVFRKTLTILLLASCAASVRAAEWKIDPTLRLQGGYNDNIRLTTDDEVSSAEATFSPSAIFSVEHTNIRRQWRSPLRFPAL